MSTQIDEVLEEKQKNKNKEKKVDLYNLVFHNDDTTPFDFVIFLLINIVNKNVLEAEMITLKIHNSDAAAVHQDVYPVVLDFYERIKEIVRDEGLNFKVTMEKAE